MTELEIKASRALPPEYVRDGTCIAMAGGMAVALHPELPLIAFKDGKWFNTCVSWKHESDEDDHRRNLIVSEVRRVV